MFNGLVIRFRLILALLAVLVLVPAASASAGPFELGNYSTPAKPGCPETSTCLAVTKTTAYQARVGDSVNPFVAPSDGRIIAFTLSLGDPTSKQIGLFEQRFGGTAQVRVTVLDLVRSRALTRRVVAQSGVFKPTPYFGTTSQFALDATLPVKKGQVVALTVPTWLPILATDVAKDNQWRASRRAGHCGTDTDPSPFFQQTAMQKVGQTSNIGCTYSTARLTYSVTMIAKPAPKYDGRHHIIKP